MDGVSITSSVLAPLYLSFSVFKKLNSFKEKNIRFRHGSDECPQELFLSSNSSSPTRVAYFSRSLNAASVVHGTRINFQTLRCRDGQDQDPSYSDPKDLNGVFGRKHSLVLDIRSNFVDKRPNS